MISLRALVLCLSLSLLAAPVQAQMAASGPEMGSAATSGETPEAASRQAPEVAVAPSSPLEGPYNILIIGDGLAGGLGAGLARLAAPEPTFVVINRFQETSGLARPEVYDWADNLPKITANKNIKAAVVLIGINDHQDIRVGDAVYSFGTPEWQRAYITQIQRLTKALKAAQIKVFWIALPPMADAQYESDMQLIRDLQKKSAESEGATYVDFRAAFTNPDGSYTDRGPDDTGEIRKLRTRDGVTFLKQGNNKLGQLMLGSIKANLATDAAPSLTIPDEGDPTDLTKSSDSTVPVFGQSLFDGSSQTSQPDMTPIVTIGTPSLKINNGQLFTSKDLVKGSDAEKLFVEGLAPPIPQGRIDDFSQPPSPPAP